MTDDKAMDILTVYGTEAPFPHCDQRVLHAPGTCSTCDHYPTYQALRIMWGICFTNVERQVNGEDFFDVIASGKLPCPAAVFRNVGTINQWGGNVPRQECAV